MKYRLLIFVVFFLLATTAYGQACSNTNLGTGITCVNSKNSIGTTSAAVTYSSGYAAGTLIVVEALGAFGTDFSSGNLTNTAGYTWTFYGNFSSGTNDFGIWYTKVVSLNASSDTITVAKTGGAGYVAVNSAIYTGISAIHGAGANASGNGLSVASGNYTVTVYDLNIGLILGETVSGGSGWNVRASDDNGGTSPYSLIEDQIAATTTANATATNGIFDPWISVVLAFTPNSAGGPVITSLNASSALPGDSVVATGIGFTGSPTVTVNGASATVTGSTSTTVTFTVPSTTTGNVVVTVSAVASNSVALTVGPVITLVNPIWGTVGATFTITGTSFGASQGGSTVTVNGTTASINSWSSTSISANAPNVAPGNVVVTAASIASNGVYFRVGTTTPVLPQATVSLTMPSQGASACPTLTTGSNCKRTPASGSASDLQSALNAATCGDTIILAAGSTYSGNFSVPQTTCTNNSGWMVIQSSALASLPAVNHRVSPSDASNMPIISTANTQPVFNFAPSSNHWRLIGIDITMSYVDTSGGNSDNFGRVFSGLTGGGNDITSVGSLPDQLIFDRVLILGLSNTNVVRGLLLNTQAAAVVDSYCDEIHANDRDSQCINTYNGPGPFLIQNNFLRASGENIMYGGSDPAIADLIPSDITFVGNDVEKKVSWRSNTGATAWTVKNLFESKNFQRVLIDGNVFQYTWNGQQNEAVLIRSVNQDGGCTWCASADVTFTHNLVAHSGHAFEVDPCDCTHPSQATQRVIAQNNVFTDISGATWGTGNNGGIYVWNAINSSMPVMHDIFVDHNDGFEDGIMIYLGDSGCVSNAQFTNNLNDYGANGIQGTGQGQGNGTATLDAFLCPYTWDKNVLTHASAGGWPAGTLWSTNLAGLGMTAVTGTDPDLTGNFKLTAGSTYHNAGTDGKDIGVWDWPNYNNSVANALAGLWVPLNSRDVYLAQSSSGAADGTSCTDPRAASYFNSSGNWGSSSTQIGDDTTVHLCGTVTTDLSFQASASSGHSVVLDGTGATLSAQISTNGKDYWTIQNVTWSTSYPTGCTIVLNIPGGSNGLIQTNTMDVHDPGPIIFLADNAAGDGLAHDIVIKNNYMRNAATSTACQSDLIDTEGSYNVTISGNYFEMRSLANGEHDDIIQTYQKGGLNGGPPHDWTIKYNKLVMNTTASNNKSFMMMEALGSGTVIVSANVFSGIAGGDSGNGIVFDNNDAGMTANIYGNTIAQHAGGPNNLFNLLDSGTFNIKNNIIENTDAGNALTGGATPTRANNIWHGTNLPSCNGSEICADPKFANFASHDYSLQSSSPARSAGINLGSTYNEYPLPTATWPNPTLGTRSTWDIGAYDYSPPASSLGYSRGRLP